MKSFFTLLLLLLLVFHATSCSNTNSMEKKRNFELHLKNPMSKNVPHSKIYFDQEDDSTVANNENNKIKNKYNNYKGKKNLKNDKRTKLVEYALKFNGNKTVKKDKKFRNDCSGFVRSVYDNFDIELYNTDKVKNGKHWLPGTQVIYNFVKDNGKVFTKETPKIGDIIFFDNTTDRNRDGKVNDKFTHIAIVIDVKKDGTIHYIHKSNRGINIQKLNLKYTNKAYIKVGKERKKVNSYLRKRKKGDSKRTPYLSSQMFRSFGSLF